MLNPAKYLPRRIRLPLQIGLICCFSWSLTAMFHLAGTRINPMIVLTVYATTIVLVSTFWGIALALLEAVICGVGFAMFVPALSGWAPSTLQPRWAVVLFAGGIGIAIGLLVRTSQGRATHAAEQEFIRGFSAKLLRLQDEERRKIARELHDSLGQYLTAVKINLDLLEHNDLHWKPKNELLADSRDLLDRALTEMRTLSYLLHPPLLDEAGFIVAARDYITGFAQRSGIHATLFAAQELDRLPQPVEMALFRILQECLTNVHRHSAGKIVTIQIEQNAEFVMLEIKDDGHGVSPDILQRFRERAGSAGVGLAGMCERAKELGGDLKLRSATDGTVVTVTIPLVGPQAAKSYFANRPAA